MPSKRRVSEEEEEEEEEEAYASDSSHSDDIAAPDEPPSIDPYTILSLDRTATPDQVKSAYRRAALKHHPDKAAPEDKDTAHTKFQEIAFAYAILSDERRRTRYDTTGRTEDSIDDDDDFNWTNFFREQYVAVTADRINEFSDKYKGSDEEREHVLAAYEKCQGGMDKLYQEVMLSEPDQDEERFRAIIEKAIGSGEVEEYANYKNESMKSRQARIARAKKHRDREAKEAEKAAEEIEEENAERARKQGSAPRKGKSNGSMGDLAALIQSRQQGRAVNFFDGLEAKYAPKGKAKGGKRAAPMDEPPEEAFAKNREKKAKR